MPSHRVDLDPSLDAKLYYRIVFKTPHDRIAAARAFVMASLGVRIEETSRAVDGFRASPAAGGLRLPEPLGTGTSTRTKRDEGWLLVTGPRMRVSSFFSLVSGQLGMPIDVPPMLGQRDFKCDVKVPVGDPEAAAEVIREALGIELEPAKLDVTVLRVSPDSDG